MSKNNLSLLYFINQIGEKKQKDSRKYLLAPLITYIETINLTSYHKKFKGKEQKALKNIRNYFAHYHAQPPKSEDWQFLAQAQEQQNNNTLNLYNTLISSKVIPIDFSIIVFNKILSEYRGDFNKEINEKKQNKFYFDLFKQQTKIEYKAEKKDKKDKNKEIKTLEIAYSGRFRFRVSAEYWHYFFIKDGDDFKEQFTNQDTKRELENFCKKYQKKSLYRIGKSWIENMGLETTIAQGDEELKKHIEQEYKNKPKPSEIDLATENITKYFKESKTKTIKAVEEGGDIKLKFTLPKGNKIQAKNKITITELIINIKSKKIYKASGNTGLVDYFLSLSKVEYNGSTFLQDLMYHLGEINSTGKEQDQKREQDNEKRINDIIKELTKDQNNPNAFYVELEKFDKKDKEGKKNYLLSKLKNEIDKLIRQNYSYGVRFVKQVMEFEKDYLKPQPQNCGFGKRPVCGKNPKPNTTKHKKEPTYTDFLYKNIKDESKKDLEPILQEKNINLKNLMEGLKKFRNAALHYNFAPEVGIEAVTNFVKEFKEQGLENIKKGNQKAESEEDKINNNKKNNTNNLIKLAKALDKYINRYYKKEKNKDATGKDAAEQNQKN